MWHDTFIRDTNQSNTQIQAPVWSPQAARTTERARHCAHCPARYPAHSSRTYSRCVRCLWQSVEFAHCVPARGACDAARTRDPALGGGAWIWRESRQDDVPSPWSTRPDPRWDDPWRLRSLDVQYGSARRALRCLLLCGGGCAAECLRLSPVRCGELQWVAVSCSELQCIEADALSSVSSRELQRVAVSCGDLQCVAVHGDSCTVACRQENVTREYRIVKKRCSHVKKRHVKKRHVKKRHVKKRHVKKRHVKKRHVKKRHVKKRCSIF